MCNYIFARNKCRHHFSYSRWMTQRISSHNTISHKCIDFVRNLASDVKIIGQFVYLYVLWECGVENERKHSVNFSQKIYCVCRIFVCPRLCLRFFVPATASLSSSSSPFYRLLIIVDVSTVATSHNLRPLFSTLYYIPLNIWAVERNIALFPKATFILNTTGLFCLYFNTIFEFPIQTKNVMIVALFIALSENASFWRSTPLTFHIHYMFCTVDLVALRSARNPDVFPFFYF